MSENVINLRSSLRAMISSLNRLNDINEPVLRYKLFLEATRLAIDIGYNIGKGQAENKTENLEYEIEEKEDELKELRDQVDETKDHRSKIKETERRLIKTRKNRTIYEEINKLIDEMAVEYTKYLDGFSEWIQQPIYSPDHPYGAKMMQNSQTDFTARDEKINKS